MYTLPAPIMDPIKSNRLLRPPFTRVTLQAPRRWRRRLSASPSGRCPTTARLSVAVGEGGGGRSPVAFLFSASLRTLTARILGPTVLLHYNLSVVNFDV